MENRYIYDIYGKKNENVLCIKINIQKHNFSPCHFDKNCIHMNNTKTKNKVKSRKSSSKF